MLALYVRFPRETNLVKIVLRLKITNVHSNLFHHLLLGPGQNIVSAINLICRNKIWAVD